MELEAESGKKFITQDRLMERYTSSELMEDEKDEKEQSRRSPSPQPTPAAQADDPPTVSLPEPDTKQKREKKPVVINEYDLDQDFLKTFKEQIRLVHQQELLRKQPEETHGAVLFFYIQPPLLEKE